MNRSPDYKAVKESPHLSVPELGSNSIVGVQSIIGPRTSREGEGPEYRLTILLTAWRGPDGRLRREYRQRLSAYRIGSESELRSMALAAARTKLVRLEFADLSPNERRDGMVARILSLAPDAEGDAELEALYRDPPIPHAFSDPDFGDFLLNLDMYDGKVQWAGKTVGVAVRKGPAPSVNADLQVLRGLKANERSWNEKLQAWTKGDLFETWRVDVGSEHGITAAEFERRLELVHISPYAPDSFMLLLRGEGLFEGFAKVDGELETGFVETRF